MRAALKIHVIAQAQEKPSSHFHHPRGTVRGAARLQQRDGRLGPAGTSSLLQHRVASAADQGSSDLALESKCTPSFLFSSVIN